jgi:hypothetical protein
MKIPAKGIPVGFIDARASIFVFAKWCKNLLLPETRHALRRVPRTLFSMAISRSATN